MARSSTLISMRTQSCRENRGTGSRSESAQPETAGCGSKGRLGGWSGPQAVGFCHEICLRGHCLNRQTADSSQISNALAAFFIRSARRSANGPTATVLRRMRLEKFRQSSCNGPADIQHRGPVPWGTNRSRFELLSHFRTHNYPATCLAGKRTWPLQGEFQLRTARQLPGQQ